MSLAAQPYQHRIRTMRLRTVAGAASLLLIGLMIPAGAQVIGPDQRDGFYAGINTGGASLGASGPLHPTGCFAAVGGCAPSVGGAGALQDSSQSFRPSGLIGGAQAGYNWQVSGNWTVGIETDFNGARVGH